MSQYRAGQPNKMARGHKLSSKIWVELATSVRENRSNCAVQNSPSEHYPEHVVVTGDG